MNLLTMWSDERMATLKRLVTERLTATEIGAEMGIGRGAVIGKLQRMGVPLSGAHGGPKRPSPRHAPTTSNLPRPRKKLVKPPSPTPDIEPELTDLPPDQSDFACTIHDLRDDTCRWPLGEPTHDMRYCGSPAKRVYCGRHRAIAYKPFWTRRA